MNLHPYVCVCVYVCVCILYICDILVLYNFSIIINPASWLQHANKEYYYYYITLLAKICVTPLIALSEEIVHI